MERQKNLAAWRPGGLALKIAVMLWLLAACQQVTVSPTVTVPATPRPTPTPELVAAARFEPAPCVFVLPAGYIEGQNVACGFLIAPENRAHLPSRALRLAVGIFHPEGGAAHPDPIVFLAGGPGGSALKFVQYQFEEAFAPMLAAGRDLILFDQRGVGVSRPALDCPGYDALALELLDRELDGRTLSKSEIADRLVAAFAACADDLRPVADLTAYHTAANAADVRDLWTALGYEEVNLWGGSYGTRLALEVLRAAPEGVRSVVLDSVYPPDVDLYVDGPANAARAFERVFDSCAANSVCAAAYPDLRAVFYDTVERLNAAPLAAPITDTLTGQSYPTLFDGDVLVGFAFSILYETDLRYLLPGFIYDASVGDLTAINRLRGALLAQRAASSRGMMASVQCHEEIVFSSPAAFADGLAQYPALSSFYDYAFTGSLMYRLCARWGAGEADALANQPVVSDIPTLILAGEFDPITPPDWGRRAAATLSRSYFFEYPGVGHGVGNAPGGCPRAMMLAFWEAPERAPDAACLAEME